MFCQRNDLRSRIQGVRGRTGEPGKVRIILVDGRLVGFYRRSGNTQTFVVRYALALLVTAIALGATLLLRRDGPTPSFLFFVPAVAISAWYGGPGPSAVATAASLILIDLNFLAPGGSLGSTASRPWR
jgi:K+-sensing histidine kinase KdpD